MASVATILATLACSAGPAPNPRGLALDQPRAVHRATTLLDGRVLITGGCTQPGCEGFAAGRTSEIFDPDTRQITPGPQASEPRASGTATLLTDGRVLLTGGYPGEGRPPTGSMELFDPQTGRFATLDEQTTPRAAHSATMTPDGRVLLAGGFGADGDALRSTEFFDPATDAVEPGPELPAPRAGHAAVEVGRRVVLIGGSDGATATTSTAVLSDDDWRDGPELSAARVKHGATTLPDGRVLVVGGSSSDEGRNLLRSTELLDIARGETKPGPDLTEGQYKLDGAVVSLPDGRVVVAAGTRLDVFDPSTNRITTIDSRPVPRRSFVTASVVDDAEVLVAGGYDDQIVPSADARIVDVGER